MLKTLLLSCLIALAGCLGGCSKKPTPPPDSSPPPQQPVAQPKASAPAATAVKRIDAATLPLADYLPPLDEGRIEIAPPAGWYPMPRDSKFVVRFYKENRNSLPRIDVMVEERTLGGMRDASESNVSEFAAQVQNDLETTGTTIVEPALPMIIGKVPCARYVSDVKLKLGGQTVVAERESLRVLKAGRLYTINLLLLPNTLKQIRDAGFDPAYAVCAGLKFVTPSAAEPAPSTP